MDTKKKKPRLKTLKPCCIMMFLQWQKKFSKNSSFIHFGGYILWLIFAILLQNICFEYHSFKNERFLCVCVHCAV